VRQAVGKRWAVIKDELWRIGVAALIDAGLKSIIGLPEGQNTGLNLWQLWARVDALARRILAVFWVHVGLSVAARANEFKSQC
jgi:hypothetical protein